MVLEDNITTIPYDPSEALQPVSFVASRVVQKGASMISQIQVWWSACSPSLLTWEEAEDLHRRFPKSPAWGQAGFQGRGNVRATKRKVRRLKPDARPTTEVKSNARAPTF